MQSSFSKIIIFAMLSAGLCLPTAWAGDAAAAAKPRLVIAEVGFATPESAEYDAAEDVYLVTNINGDPLAVDGNGFISKIAPDGRVIDLKWIDGAKPGIQLNAPKGAAILARKLFVADIDQVRIFSLPGGEPFSAVTIDGSTFLNGITPGAGGYVYVTDSGYAEGLKPSGLDAVYRVWADGRYEAVIRDRAMGHPNGVLEDGRRVVVVTFGSGKMISVDASGRQMLLPTPPGGQLDGLLRLEDGRFLISSWGGSAIYALNLDQTFSVLAEALDSPADLGFDTRRNRVLIPLFKKDQLVVLPL